MPGHGILSENLVIEVQVEKDSIGNVTSGCATEFQLRFPLAVQVERSIIYTSMLTNVKSKTKVQPLSDQGT
jgi:hypothetical protein